MTGDTDEPPAQPNPAKRGKPPVNWNTVDLTRRTRDLIAEFGVTPQAISEARKRRGINPPRRKGTFSSLTNALHLDDEARRLLLQLSRKHGLSPSDYVRKISGGEM